MRIVRVLAKVAVGLVVLLVVALVAVCIVSN
jgi:hypothetical protein